MRSKLPQHIPEELEKVGAVIVEQGTGGRHPFIRFKLHGITRKFSFPASASDWRSMLNNRSELRRVLRLMAEEAKLRKEKKVA